jgi:hypothetical protein
MQFIGQKVEIRFRPSEMDSAAIFFEGASYPIWKTDKNENFLLEKLDYFKKLIYFCKTRKY